MSDSLNIFKKINLENGEILDLAFCPKDNYIPQTATNLGSKGKLAVYLECEHIGDVSCEEMFHMINEIEVLEFFNLKHTTLVLKGLLKNSLTYFQRKELILSNQTSN